MNRADTRSQSRFKADLKRYHSIEHLWARILQVDLVSKYRTEVKLSLLGSDGTGEYIENFTDDQPDYLIDLCKNSFPLEVKTHSKHTKYPFFTYKLSSLKSCIKYQAYIITPLRNKYVILPPRTIEYIVDNYKPKVYYGYAPGKMAIRLQKDDLVHMIKNGYIFTFAWSDRALRLIKKHNNSLFG